jgi:hypothetical protein
MHSKLSDASQKLQLDCQHNEGPRILKEPEEHIYTPQKYLVKLKMKRFTETIYGSKNITQCRLQTFPHITDNTENIDKITT